jgi:hypothetical protein
MIGETIETFFEEMISTKVEEHCNDKLDDVLSDWMDSNTDKIDTAVENSLSNGDHIYDAIKKIADDGDLDDSVEKALENSLSERQIEDAVEKAVESAVEDLDLVDNVSTEVEKYLETHLADEVDESVDRQFIDNEEMHKSVANIILADKTFLASVNTMILKAIQNVFDEPTG